MLVGVKCEDPGLEFPTEIKWGDCLECAGTWNNPCSMTLPLLEVIKADGDRPHDFPSVTSLVGCLRKPWILAGHDYYEYPSSRIALLFGTWMHHMLEGTNGSGMPEIKVRWTDPNGHTLTGTADYYVPETKTLLDWKSAASLNVGRLPYDHHEVQVNLYAYMLEHNVLEPRVPVENIQMVYVSKTGPDRRKGTHNGVVRKTVEKWSTQRVETFITKRLYVLQEALAGRLVPEKVSPKWWCGYCPVANICDELPLP